MAGRRYHWQPDHRERIRVKKKKVTDDILITDYSSDISSINNEISVLQNAINRYKLDLKTLKKKSKKDNDLKQDFEKLNNEMKLINQALINISKENNEKEGNEKWKKNIQNQI